MKLRDHSSPQFARDVRQVLDAATVGMRWADNVGPVATLRYVHADAPIDVRVSTGAGQMPHAVLVLRAVNRTDQTTESGCRITWRWIGHALRVSAIDVSDTADEYDVTLGVLLG